MSIESIIDHILQVEGSAYTNHPADRGGPTKWGITQRTLSRVLGYPAAPVDVQRLTEADARGIYRKLYVTEPGFDQVAAVTPDVGAELVDSGVNVGTGRASEWLQRALNALNREGRDYADLTVDGDVGPATLTALKAYLSKRGAQGEIVLLRALNGYQTAHYLTLAERDRRQEAFVFGWLLNRVGAIA